MRLLLLLLAFTAASATANAQQGSRRAAMNAYVASLCSEDPGCIEAVRTHIQVTCAGDRPCMQALFQSLRDFDAGTVAFQDLPAGAKAVLRTVRDHESAASQAEEAEALIQTVPRRFRDQVRDACGTDVECIEEMIAEARGGEDGTEPSEPEASEPPSSQGGGTLDPGSVDLGGGPGRLEPGQAPEVDVPRGGSSSQGDRTPGEVTGSIGTGPTHSDGQGGRNRGTGPRTFPGSNGALEPLGPLTYGATSTTSVSGNEGEFVFTIVEPGNGWLAGLRLVERGNITCGVSAYFVHPEFGTWEKREDYYLFREYGNIVDFVDCRSSIPEHLDTSAADYSVAFHRTGPASGTLVTDNNDELVGPWMDWNDDLTLYAIDGLRTCQPDGGDLLRGMEVWGSAILDTETQPVQIERITAGGTQMPRKDIQMRPTCEDWRQERSCPAGQVAIGIDVHYATTQSSYAITGLSLHCARLTH